MRVGSICALGKSPGSDDLVFEMLLSIPFVDGYVILYLFRAHAAGGSQDAIVSWVVSSKNFLQTVVKCQS